MTPSCESCAARPVPLVATGSDVLATEVGFRRVVFLCPPCRGMELPDVEDHRYPPRPLTERALVRRYEKTMREHGEPFAGAQEA